MKKTWLIIIGAVLIVAILVAGFFAWRYYKNKKIVDQKTADTALIQSNPSVPAVPTPQSIIKPAPTLVYPIGNFTGRATTNFFGTYYPASGTSNPDRLICPNATYYAGYHTAIDLETTAEEANQNIPVFAA